MTFKAVVNLQGVYSLVPSEARNSTGPASFLAVLPVGSARDQGSPRDPDYRKSIDAEVCSGRNCGSELVPHRPLVVFTAQDVVDWKSQGPSPPGAREMKAVWDFAGSRLSFDTGAAGRETQFRNIEKAIALDAAMSTYGLGAFSRISPGAIEGTSSEVAAQVLIESGEIRGVGSQDGEVHVAIPGEQVPNEMRLGIGIAASLRIEFECQDFFRIEARKLGAPASSAPTFVLELSPDQTVASDRIVEVQMGSFCQNPLGWPEAENVFAEMDPATSFSPEDRADVDFKWLYNLRDAKEGLAHHLADRGFEAPVPIFVPVSMFGSPVRCYFAIEAPEVFS